MEVLYLDRLFFLNLLADYLLCLSAGRAAGLRLKRGRYLAAALLGASYAAAVWLPGFAFLASPVWKLAAGLLMAMIAYGGEERPLRCALCFFAVSAAFGGALWAVSGGGPAGLSLPALGLSFTVCYALFEVFFRARTALNRQRRVPVRVRFLGREADFLALVDTGNGLSDPLSGAPVLVACAHALRPLFRDCGALLELPPVELLERSAALPELKGKLRLLPFSALGGAGVLPVFRPEKLFIDGREDRDRLVGISPRASGDGFEAIL